MSNADAINRVTMAGRCAARKVLLVLVLTWLLPCCDFVLPKDLPEHYQKPLDLISRRKILSLQMASFPGCNSTRTTGGEKDSLVCHQNEAEHDF